jgi:hypothetical protein
MASLHGGLFVYPENSHALSAMLLISFAAGHMHRLNKKITAQQQNKIGSQSHKPFQNKRA